ncbi:putative vinorine synthase [Helianthus annuus]|uniref:Putative transferase, Chloramphenicol acetyltransferase-like domain protein n=1 Tax=Helianthus annuus TaxID=4232 RepID=A0A251T423_HELAN|nr:putative vinorine synthase [Helianthus annuus]KAJ0506013.1 putative vinorine synthase [Helianthus annuus]KAJ0675682.1 putative vinorine synthase [Helianthus annuus]KAJ0678958.1 putative vinorine synthase [Helianthus annuus]KAJ0863480.1 putative vinorine synthase [Helianthus annuus]
MYTACRKYMASSMEIISKEIIKPSSPTPNNLKTFKLSLLDQLTLHSHTAILLLYKSQHINNSDILNFFLSKTLTKYYPFAGRLEKDGITVDCGDHGVVFVEAKILGCRLSEFHAYPRYETQRLLYPEGFLWKDSCIGHMFLVAQAISFEDGCMMAAFLNDWAATAHGEVRPPPMILAASIPSLDLGYMMPDIVINKAKTCVTKRFVFGAQKIGLLKQSVSGFVETPTKGELITTVLYRCVVTSSMEKMGCFTNSNLIELVNMWRRFATQLSDNSIGNFSWYYTISKNDESQIMNLGKLVL